MTSPMARAAAIMVPLALVLSGCENLPTTEAAPGSEAAAQLGPDGPRTEIRDVERADIFSATDTGLWDGRPSLGGIWIAHPDVTEPERARITNADSGKTISGALFRRERANPGPRFQVSSDAATALGMLAGQPAELTVVAVRQEEIELEPAPLPIAEDGAAPVEGQITDAENGAETGSEDAGAEGTAALAVAGAGVAAQDSAQPRGFWGRFRDSLRNKPAADVATEADTELLEQTADSASVPEVETAPLDPVTATAAAAIATAEAESVPPASPAPPSGLANPYVQVGLFSLEENATAAAASLRQAGIVPTVSEEASGDKTLWRIFVGPVSNADEQAEILAQIKRLGYKDAFLAPN